MEVTMLCFEIDELDSIIDDAQAFLDENPAEGATIAELIEHIRDVVEYQVVGAATIANAGDEENSVETPESILAQVVTQEVSESNDIRGTWTMSVSLAVNELECYEEPSEESSSRSIDECVQSSLFRARKTTGYCQCHTDC